MINEQFRQFCDPVYQERMFLQEKCLVQQLSESKSGAWLFPFAAIVLIALLIFVFQQGAWAGWLVVHSILSIAAFVLLVNLVHLRSKNKQFNRDWIAYQKYLQEENS